MQQDTESLFLPNFVASDDKAFGAFCTEALRDIFSHDCSDEDAALARALLVPQPHRNLELLISLRTVLVHLKPMVRDIKYASEGEEIIEFPKLKGLPIKNILCKTMLFLNLVTESRCLVHGPLLTGLVTLPPTQFKQPRLFSRRGILLLCRRPLYSDR